MEKEKVLYNFLEMIKQSWTYGRFSEEEKERFHNLMKHIRITSILKGTYNQRWEILQGIYYAFLIGLDYKSIGWREEKESENCVF